jgi:hypothetical protein
MKIDTDKIKAESEATVLKAGGKICEWLPYIEFTKIRDEEQVVARALILNAMINIHFQAPTEVVADWISRHNLNSFLSEREKSILSRENEGLTEQEGVDLYWYIEALWAFLWATNIVDKMDFATAIPDSMASMCPDLQIDEGDERFTENMSLRDYDDLYKERDLYYRVMWYARQLSLTSGADPKFDMSRTMERRKALEWIMDAELDWDDVPLDT